MAVRLFVGNLPYTATEAELREHFSAVGAPSYVYLPTDRETGRPRGFAFVEFNDPAQAQEAIRRFNNQPFKGRPMVVNEAREKDSRPRAGTPPPRTASPPRPMGPRPGFGDRPDPGEFSAGREAPGRNFGPDAPPRRSRSKAKSSPRTERAPKGPMREVVRGQFFGGDDDDNYDDDLSGENFASSEGSPDAEDDEQE